MGIMLGLGVTAQLSVGVAASFSIEITGLTGGEARPGDHASIGYTTDPVSATETVEWGTTAGDSTYGTGASPTDFTAGDTGNLVLTVTDGGEVVSASAPIRYAAGTAPAIADGQSWTVDDTSVNLDASASGTGLTWSYGATGLPAGVSINTGTGAITGTPTAVDSGTVTVTATDQYGRTVQDTFTFTNALRAQATGGADLDLSFPEDSAISSTDLTANWTEGGNTVTYAIVGTALPTGLSVSSAGAMTGTPTTVTADDTYTLRGTDEYARTTDDTFTLEITAVDATAPVINTATWTSATQTLDVTFTEGSGTVRAYAVSVNPASGDPSAAQIIAGSGAGILEAYDSTSQVASLSDVDLGFTATSDGTYEVHVLLVDTTGNQSTITIIENTLLDATAPTLVPASCTPADGATDIAIASNITLIFSETVVAGTGNFYIYSTAGPALVETIAVGSATIGTTDVVLNPVSDLSNSTAYSVRWDAGVVEDAQGNGVAVNSTDTLLNFTTIASGPSYALQEQFDYADNAQANNITGITVTVAIGAQTDVAIVSSELAISSGYADIEVEFDGTYSQDNLTEMLITEPGTEASDGQIELCANFSDFDNYYSIGLDYANSNVLFRKGRTGTWDTAITFTAAEAIVDGVNGGSLDLTAASIGTPIVLGVQSTAADVITAYINGVQVSNTVDDSSAPITATGNPNIRISEAAGYTVGEVRLTEL